MATQAESLADLNDLLAVSAQASLSINEHNRLSGSEEAHRSLANLTLTEMMPEGGPEEPWDMNSLETSRLRNFTYHSLQAAMYGRKLKKQAEAIERAENTWDGLLTLLVGTEIAVKVLHKGVTAIKPMRLSGRDYPQTAHITSARGVIGHERHGKGFYLSLRPDRETRAGNHTRWADWYDVTALDRTSGEQLVEIEAFS